MTSTLTSSINSWILSHSRLSSLGSPHEGDWTSWDSKSKVSWLAIHRLWTIWSGFRVRFMPLRIGFPWCWHWRRICSKPLDPDRITTADSLAIMPQLKTEVCWAHDHLNDILDAVVLWSRVPEVSVLQLEH
jgi:hypothetical protein